MSLVANDGKKQSDDTAVKRVTCPACNGSCGDRWIEQGYINNFKPCRKCWGQGMVCGECGEWEKEHRFGCKFRPKLTNK